MEPEEFREQCAVKLLKLVERATHLRAFVGLDGFVDEIIHMVDKRDSAESFQRITTMTKFAERIAAAAGKSTNIERVVERTKLGGNGPIMANALARFGIRVTYVGALGYPVMHPVFTEFAQRAEVHSICEPGNTNALEFDDGKVMLTKTSHFSEITWPTIQARFSRDKFIEHFSTADLVGFVNWTQVPYMSELWAALLREFCPNPTATRRSIFFDLADPEKRTAKDLRNAIELISSFEKFFEVIFGMNEKEAGEVGSALGLSKPDNSRDALGQLSREIQKRTGVSTVVIHPVTCALAVSKGTVSLVDGPYVAKPVITTGAGDHFNAGFCLGKLLGFDNEGSVLLGVTTSGYYVRNGQSPGIAELVQMLRDWPERHD
jgi:sugar/nucleoside kinase (ribokinase family)